MWRRVSCEQLLDTSQSLLRLRGNPIKLCGVFSLTRPQLWPKGNEVLIPQPDSGTDSALVPTRQREMSLRRPPELWEELSFLHKLPRPWNSFEERMGFGLAKSAAVLAVSMSDRRNLENLSGVTALSHQLVPISAAGLQGEQPLVDRIM